MSAEHGVFNAEGLIEGGFYTPEAAQAAVAELTADGDNADVYAALVCVEHPDQPHDNCEECDDEDQEDDQ